MSTATPPVSGGSTTTAADAPVGATPSGPSPTAPRIAVIGGGISGLAAAERLTTRGAAVVILEADGHLGGKLQTSPFAGRPVDHAADAFLARQPDATRLAHLAGLGDRLVAPRTTAARVWHGGALVPLPAAQVLGVPADPDAADLAALLSPTALDQLRNERDHGSAPAFGEDGGDGGGPSDESIGTHLRRRLGDEVVDVLVGPLVGGINAGDVDALSLAALTPQLAELAHQPSVVSGAAAQRARADAVGPTFLAPEGGMARLPEALAATLRARGVEVRTGVVVRSLERLEAGWRVIADPASGDGVATDSTFDVDAVVVCLPAPVAATLIQDHAPIAAMHLGSLAHASVALTLLAFVPDAPPPRSPEARGSGFVVPASSGLVLTACSWASAKWAHLSPDRGDGTVVVRASAGRFTDRRIAELDDDALVERLVDDLGATAGLSGAPVAARVHRWPSSFPQYAPGHLVRVAEIDADLAAVGTLGLAGNALRGVGIPACIRSGARAADRVLDAVADR